MSVISGTTYHIVNAKSNTAMDLSGVDSKTIIGYPSHNGRNQQWTLNWVGNAWTFRSVSSGLYLGLAGSPANGTRLVAVSEPVSWHIWHDEIDPSSFRVFVPFTHYNLDLYNYGDPVPGDPITLWGKWNGTHQTWKFTSI